MRIARRVPFDFFSWHAYTSVPALYGSIAAAVRSRLDAAGLSHVSQHVTEWFPCVLCPAQDTAAGAVAVAATLVEMVEAGVKVATLYPLCSADENNRTGGRGWGLFDGQSEPGAALWRPLTHAFAYFARLVKASDGWPEIRRNQSNGAGLSVIAGVKLAGAGTAGVDDVPRAVATVGVMIAAEQPLSPLGGTPPDGFNLELCLTGMQPRQPVRFTVEVTNSTSAKMLALAGEAIATSAGQLEIAFKLEPPAVAYVYAEMG